MSLEITTLFGLNEIDINPWIEAYFWKYWVQNFSCVSAVQKEFPFLCLVKTRVSNWNCQKDTLKSLTVSGNFCFCKIFLHLFRQNVIWNIKIKKRMQIFYSIGVSSKPKSKKNLSLFSDRFSVSFIHRKVLKILGGFCQMGWELWNDRGNVPS